MRQFWHIQPPAVGLDAIGNHIQLIRRQASARQFNANHLHIVLPLTVYAHLQPERHEPFLGHTAIQKSLQALFIFINIGRVCKIICRHDRNPLFTTKALRHKA